MTPCFVCICICAPVSSHSKKSCNSGGLETFYLNVLYRSEEVFPVVPLSYKSGTKNLLCDTQTESDQLILTNITLLFLSWVSPCFFYSVRVVSEMG